MTKGLDHPASIRYAIHDYRCRTIVINLQWATPNVDTVSFVGERMYSDLCGLHIREKASWYMDRKSGSTEEVSVFLHHIIHICILKTRIAARHEPYICTVKRIEINFRSCISPSNVLFTIYTEAYFNNPRWNKNLHISTCVFLDSCLSWFWFCCLTISLTIHTLRTRDSQPTQKPSHTTITYKWYYTRHQSHSSLIRAYAVTSISTIDSCSRTRNLHHPWRLSISWYQHWLILN